MRSKRLSILVPCLLIAIVLVFIFSHAHHRHESVAADQKLHAYMTKMSIIA